MLDVFMLSGWIAVAVLLCCIVRARLTGRRGNVELEWEMLPVIGLFTPVCDSRTDPVIDSYSWTGAGYHNGTRLRRNLRLSTTPTT